MCGLSLTGEDQVPWKNPPSESRYLLKMTVQLRSIHLNQPETKPAHPHTPRKRKKNDLFSNEQVKSVVRLEKADSKDCPEERKGADFVEVTFCWPQIASPWSPQISSTGGSLLTSRCRAEPQMQNTAHPFLLH